ncbi:uncharacterized protein SCHCODRAFT_01334098 [Schizophyllum commune H4-8]|uniref:uncharacterized protein n=1 Tax=Schizophyllum commune (strain H4-8 / FGSC 9210) TaxID=578458 RepID=UPI00216054DB|nr:uncharacterized protein SCHCODRAFT_01334098 [Schizophyllum commune H4-8]KAI5888814.1 hypothetical protein SCHCODRAFT_01334098 [Schizophyllum commune H4-8]
MRRRYAARASPQARAGTFSAAAAVSRHSCHPGISCHPGSAGALETTGPACLSCRGRWYRLRSAAFAVVNRRWHLLRSTVPRTTLPNRDSSLLMYSYALYTMQQ